MMESILIKEVLTDSVSAGLWASITSLGAPARSARLERRVVDIVAWRGAAILERMKQTDPMSHFMGESLALKPMSANHSKGKQNVALTRP